MNLQALAYHGEDLASTLTTYSQVFTTNSVFSPNDFKRDFPHSTKVTSVLGISNRCSFILIRFISISCNWLAEMFLEWEVATNVATRRGTLTEWTKENEGDREAERDTPVDSSKELNNVRQRDRSSPLAAAMRNIVHLKYPCFLVILGVKVWDYRAFGLLKELKKIGKT